MLKVTDRSQLPDLPFRRCRAIPKPVTAVRLTTDIRQPNPFASDGTYQGKAGAWRITYGRRADGSIDEAICDPEVFVETYEPLGGDQYRKRQAVVTDAAQLQEPLELATLEGPARGKPGDWLLLGVHGEPYFNDDAYFRASYEPVE